VDKIFLVPVLGLACRSTSGVLGHEKPESNSTSAGSPASSSLPNTKYSQILTEKTYHFSAFSFTS
jgi:hypothetical protein